MTITAFYAGLLAIWFFVLSIRVIQGRIGPGKPGLGDGGDAAMLRKIRAHGNFAEYTPIVLVLMLLLETGGGTRLMVHAIGASLLAGRLLHGYAFSFTPNSPIARTAGMVLTLTALATGAVLCLWRGAHAL